MEEDVTELSANEREERNAAASSTTVDSRCGDGGRDFAPASDSTTFAVKKTWKRTMPKNKKSGLWNAMHSREKKSRA